MEEDEEQKKARQGLKLKLTLICVAVWIVVFAITYIFKPDSRTSSILLLVAIGSIVASLIYFNKKYPTAPLSEVTASAEPQQPGHAMVKPTLFKHVSGLPLAEDAPVNLEESDGAYHFWAKGFKIDLSENKVTSVMGRSERDLQQQFVSSVGGAAMGHHLAGAIGAAILGRAKKRTIKDITYYYLVIVYSQDSGATSTAIVLEAGSPSEAVLFENAFNYRAKKESRTIEL